MKAGTKFLVGAAVIVAAVGFLIAEGVKETGVYFLTPTENAALEVDRGVINPPRQIGATFTYRFE